VRDSANIHLDEAELHRIRFDRSRLTGAVLAGAHLEDVTFVACRLDLCNVRFARLERVRFEGCAMRGADLQGVQCSSVEFRDCELAEVSWTRAALERTELRRCDLTGSNGLEGLRGARMAYDDVIRSMHEIVQAAGIHVID
jgi:uncharacterized protein YjbI with pentapeptide repeats